MGSKVARLYEQFQPEHYQLHLIPDRDAMTFSGTVTIRGKKVGRPSERLTFHQKDLKITDAQVIKHDKKGDQKLEVARINTQNTLHEVRVHAKDKVYPGAYTVTLEFTGKITKPMNGIYPCYFKHDGQDKMLIATQFESHFAREAFPCIDEPEAKATFDLALTTPAGETVIANTPVRSQTKEGDSMLTKFETTPRMSSYLLAFAYGELGYKEAKTKDGIVVRTYATPDNVRLTEHGLQFAVKALEFFSDYFGVPYPLPKLDMLALPDFSAGAMENWGLVTYRETTMLADPKTSSIESKQLVAMVVGHELSHQWFGNLVTMKWWDDLWLNESFANLMEYVVVDAIYPEWHVWEHFVSGETGSAKRRDSLADVQPIKMGVSHPDEINTLFDPSIVYAKGGTVLHMLLEYIGEDAFRRGLKVYFDKHRYSNTQADDLWEALSAASGQNIHAFMDGWLKRPGYPLITVDWQPGSQTVELAQQRFLSDPTAKPDATEPWHVPLAATRTLAKPLLDKPRASTQISNTSKAPFILNHDGNSYFLPRYTVPAHLAHIVDAVKQDQVDAIDRLLLLDNYTMLQRGGLASTTELLDLLSGYEHEASESVWGAIAVAIGEARRLIEGDKAAEGQVDTLANGLVAKLVAQLGWDDSPKDSAQTLRLRGLAHSIAAGAKNAAVLKAALERFRSCKSPGDLAASTRTVIYYVAARYGTASDFKKLLELYRQAANADEKDELASGLTGAKEPARYKQLIDMLKTDDIRRQDLMHWFVWLLRNRYSRTSTWQWLLDNWSWVEQEFSSDKSYSFFARYPGSIFSRPAELVQFNDFFEPKKSILAMTRDITLAQQEIMSRVAWRQRNEADVKAWLKKQ